MKSQQKYLSTLENHGIWKKEKDLLQNLEEFICAMYGDQLKNVNELCYKMYCPKRGKISFEISSTLQGGFNWAL